MRFISLVLVLLLMPFAKAGDKKLIEQFRDSLGKVGAGYDETLFRLAGKSMGNGQYLKAAENYWKIIEGFRRSPYFNKAMLGIGEAYLKSGELKKAEKAFILVRDKYGNESEKKTALALLEKVKQRKLRERIVSRNQASDMIRQSLELQLAGKFDDALKIYERIEVPVWSEEVKVLSIIAEFQSGRFREVSCSVADFLSSDRESEWASLLKALKEKADVFLSQPAENKENILKKRYQKLSDLLERMEYEKALFILDDIIRRTPWDYETMLTKAVLLSHLGRNHEALQLLGGISTNAAEVKSILGYLNYKEGRLKQARHFYEQAAREEKSEKFRNSCSRAMRFIKKTIKEQK